MQGLQRNRQEGLMAARDWVLAAKDVAKGLAETQKQVIKDAFAKDKKGGK